MAQFRIERLTALPGTPTANTMYFINPPGEDDYCELYVTGNTNTVVRRIITESDVTSLINQAIGSANLLQIVDDITERDGLVLDVNTFVFVKDASDDPTVTSGAAMYLWDATAEEFIKVAEYESLDITVDWSDIANKPSSAVADIDDAVSKRHAHSNLTQLEKIGESGGRFTYNGTPPTIDWTTASW